MTKVKSRGCAFIKLETMDNSVMGTLGRCSKGEAIRMTVGGGQKKGVPKGTPEGVGEGVNYLTAFSATKMFLGLVAPK